MNSSDSISDNAILISILVLTILIIIIYVKERLSKIRDRQNSTNLICELSEVKSRLKELDRRKSEFVSFTSHQLRGPMSLIQGHASLILDGDYGEVPQHLTEPIKRILKSSQVLGDLINDFLDVAKIEKGEIEFDIVTFNIVEVLNQAIDRYEDIINKSSLKLVKSYKDTSKIEVRGDVHKIKQVFINVLDNAVKYTPRGTITVSLLTDSKDVIISIKDTGIGIDSSDINNLFNKFTRAKNADDMDVMGSGLGLFVAKEIMTAQNGSIWVESQGEGKGSTFFIKIPLKS